MSNETENCDTKSPRFQRHGVRWNGYVLPWPILGALTLLVFNAGVNWAGYIFLRDEVANIRAEVSSLDDESSFARTERGITITRISNVEEALRDHRNLEHKRP